MRELTPEECEFIAGGYDPYGGSTETPNIIVVAAPPPPPYYPPPYSPPYLPPAPSGGGSGGGGGTGGGDTTPPPPDTGCADGEAVETKDEIIDMDDDHRREYISFTYTDANGVAQHSAPTGGDAAKVSAEDVRAHLLAMANSGVDLGSITGITHNHPASVMTSDTQFALNRYPSPEDWVQAQAVADLITAAGGDPSDLSLYILGPDNILREFKLADRSQLEDLSVKDMENGVDLPPPTTPCGG